MTCFVLVHGAFHGGWCWSPVAQLLQKLDNEVYTPTLTGLGERSHLLHEGIGLDVHIADVAQVIRYEQLDEVVLVGHSYAGMLLAGIAQLAGPAVREVVVVDGFVPRRGEAALDLLPEDTGVHYRGAALASGDGWRIPPRPLGKFGVRDGAALTWLGPRLGPQPLRTYTDPCPVGADEVDVRGRFLLCAGWETRFEPAAARAAALGWDVARLPADHEVMATNPHLLVEHLAFPPVANAS